MGASIAMSLLTTLAGVVPSVIRTGVMLLARKVGLTPGPDIKRLRGPAHVYPPPGSVMECLYGVNRCMGCPRVDPEHTPLTDPPCARDRIYPDNV